MPNNLNKRKASKHFHRGHTSDCAATKHRRTHTSPSTSASSGNVVTSLPKKTVWWSTSGNMLMLAISAATFATGHSRSRGHCTGTCARFIKSAASPPSQKTATRSSSHSNSRHLSDAARPNRFDEAKKPNSRQPTNEPTVKHLSIRPPLYAAIC